MVKTGKAHREAGDTVVLYPGNYINDIEGEKLEDTCDEYLKRGFAKVIMDFTSTDLINSIGISILIGIIEKVREHGGTVYFSGLKKVNKDVFNIVGLTKHARVFNTEDEAIIWARESTDSEKILM